MTRRMKSLSLLVLTYCLLPAFVRAQVKLPPDPALLATATASFKLNPQEKAPVTLGPDGGLCLCVSGKDILVSDRAAIMLTPQLPEGKFEHARSILVVNRKVVEEKSTLNDTNPTFRVDMSDTAMSAKRISVVGEDTFRKQVDLLTCTLHRAASSNAPQATFKTKPDQIVLATSGPTLKTVYVFLGGDYAGAITGDVPKYSVDIKSIPPGQYTFTTVAESEDGALAAPATSTISVSSRYKVTASALNETFGVEKEMISLPIKIERGMDSDASSVQVYLDNKLISDGSKLPLELNSNLSEVYTGLAELRIVGKHSDGFQLPAETIRLKVQNYFLNTTGLSQTLDSDTSRLKELDQQIEYWYTKAINERDTITTTSGGQQNVTYGSGGFAQHASTTILNSITVRPGKQAEYMANCKKAVVERAQVRLHVAQTYKQMGRNVAFRECCLRIVREMGSSSGLGKAALQLLADG